MKLTDQEAFDIMVNHLRAQGVKAQVWSSNIQAKVCRYRTPDGRKCAVGALIPDKLYEPCMEGSNIDVLLADNPVLARYFKGVHPDMLRMVQVVHDRYPEEEWTSELAKVAEHYHLKYTPPEDAPK